LALQREGRTGKVNELVEPEKKSHEGEKDCLKRKKNGSKAEGREGVGMQN